MRFYNAEKETKERRQTNIFEPLSGESTEGMHETYEREPYRPNNKIFHRWFQDGSNDENFP